MPINYYIVAIRVEISAPFVRQRNTYAFHSISILKHFWKKMFLQTSKLLYLFALAMVANPLSLSNEKSRHETILATNGLDAAITNNH